VSDWVAGLLEFALLIAALGVSWYFLGNYMARVFTSDRHTRVERVLYRGMGVDPDADQRWSTYLRSLLAFSVVGVLLLYGIQRLQSHLGLTGGFPGVSPAVAFNTAASFVTNTNWQSYSGESTMSIVTQASGLTVQNFLSAAVGIAAAIALVRGFIRSRSDRLGNFWVDITRTMLRILLPISIIAAVLLLALGVVENLHVFTDVTSLAGQKQTLPGGLIASQEAIKDLGNNGGGPFNANSSHPFENPTAVSDLFEIYLLLVIPFALTRTFGVLIGDRRQGVAILATMGAIWVSMIGLIDWSESAHRGAVPQLVGAALEGKELRFGIPASAIFAGSTTLTSTGSVNSFHDSFTALGGGGTVFDIVTGEIAPGGVGAGIYGILSVAVIAVFVAGLMVGRTPEYLGKKLGGREIKLASLYILTTPFFVLVGAGSTIAQKGQLGALLNSAAGNLPGSKGSQAHGLTEIFYAYASASNNNGSAFAGLTVTDKWYEVTLALCMLFARFLPIAFAIALGGSLARQSKVPATAGTLPTHGPLFVGLLLGVVIILIALTYVPALFLGPLAEGLS
jgi:K+-transporting ATPase ATPase A chain